MWCISVIDHHSSIIYHPMRPFAVAVVTLCLAALSFAADLPRSPGAQLIEDSIRATAKPQKIDKADLDAFLKNLGDDALLQNCAADLFDDLQAALETRTMFPWTRDLSALDFRRYVLPVRVSGEPVQHFRRTLMTELSEVVKNCNTAEDAALEVNLWLGSRVTFKPTDRREQGVLTTLHCGFGRCGEETIIATAALRSVGVAARMVYVPYWAHQDNNHAWVEAKTGERWKYLGACEPEAALNRAWFDEPVMRAPILQARCYDLDSTEADAVRGVRGWAVNSTRNYFEPCKLVLEFPPNWGKDDQLWLAIFNYAAVLPIARLDNHNGRAAIEVGNGDFLLLGARAGKRFMQPAHCEYGTERVVKVNPELPLPESLVCEFPFDKKESARDATPEWHLKLEQGRTQLELTQARKNEVPKWLPLFLGKTDSTTAKLMDKLVNAPGNALTIRDAWSAADAPRKKLLLELLETLSEKDLRELDSLTLDDALRGAKTALSGAQFADDSLRRFVISPRINWEVPRPWRAELAAKVGAINGTTALERAKAVNALVAKRVANIRQVRPADPLTLWNAGKVNETAATWLACGLLRNAGVPAYVTEGADFVTFHDGTAWKPLDPAHPERIGVVEEQVKAWFGDPATVTISARQGVNPVMEETFNLMPIKDGWPDQFAENVLDYSAQDSAATLKLVPARYLLTWGARNSRGDVKLGARELEFVAGQTAQIELPIERPADAAPQAEWSIDPATEFAKLPNPVALNALETDTKLIVVLAAQHEPSARMLDALKTFSAAPATPLTLAGPGQQLSMTHAADALLAALRIPLEPQEFRNGAPYYRVVTRDGNVLASGNGYRLDMAGFVAKATHP
jgi:hypothetical protein